MSRRISVIAARLIEEQLDKQSGGDQVWFEVNPMMRPAQNNPQIPEVVLMVTMWLKGALLDTVLYASATIDLPTEFKMEYAEAMVRQMLEGLRKQRSATLSQVQQGAPVEALPR
jgi:hypothetical protein